MSAIERLRSLSNEVERGRSALGRLPRVLTDATDQALQELGRGVPNVAIVAVGGYGRRQQCLHSDIEGVVIAVPELQRDSPEADTSGNKPEDHGR